jgi:hypothetical protein
MIEKFQVQGFFGAGIGRATLSFISFSFNNSSKLESV